MTLLELKKELHEKIGSLNDDSYLEMLNDMLAHKEDVFIVPKHMNERIRRGQEDVKNGNVINMEEWQRSMRNG